MTWQAIETAPKDSGPILGFFPARKGQILPMYWDADAYAKRPQPHWSSYGYLWGRADLKRNQPTHWMPLPDPPAGFAGAVSQKEA